MVIFNSYVKLPEGNYCVPIFLSLVMSTFPFFSSCLRRQFFSSTAQEHAEKGQESFIQALTFENGNPEDPIEKQLITILVRFFTFPYFWQVAICISVYIYIHIRMYIYIHVYVVYIYVYIYMYIIYIYIYTHISIWFTIIGTVDPIMRVSIMVCNAFRYL